MNIFYDISDEFELEMQTHYPEPPSKFYFTNPLNDLVEHQNQSNENEKMSNQDVNVNIRRFKKKKIKSKPIVIPQPMTKETDEFYFPLRVLILNPRTNRYVNIGGAVDRQFNLSRIY